MEIIDAHQHFWKYDPVRDAWITKEMGAICRDFLPVDLSKILRSNGIAGTVVVQSDQSEEENLFQLMNAENNDFIKAIVGWVDLQSANVEDRLNHYSQYPKMKGFRHVLQGETNRALMLSHEFKKGISLLNQFNFTYDLLVLPDQLNYCTELVQQFPNQLFVIDHIAKPGIKSKAIADWKLDIQTLAKHENVYCKISGLVTEADWRTWQKLDLFPYIDVVVEAFGPKRIMFGSDWPVCLLSASYEATLGIVKDYFSSFSQGEQEDYFRMNATRFYNLN